MFFQKHAAPALEFLGWILVLILQTGIGKVHGPFKLGFHDFGLQLKLGRGGGHGFLELCGAAVEIHAFLPIDLQCAGHVHCLAGMSD